MNEEALKEIWRKDEVVSVRTGTIDFNAVEKNIRGWQQRLRRKIKLDILFNVLVYVLLVPLFFYMPVILYFSPFILFVWIWYLWENIRIYRNKTNFTDDLSSRDYLANKKRLLEGYIRRARHIIYLLTPLALFTGFYFSNNFQAILRSPIALTIIFLSTEILLLIMVETWVRKVFAPSLRELNNLLRQFEPDVSSGGNTGIESAEAL